MARTCGFLAVLLALSGAGCGTGIPKPVAESAALKAPAWGDYEARAQVRECHPLEAAFLEAVTDFSAGRRFP